MLKQQRVNKLVRIFIEKLKRNSQSRAQPDKMFDFREEVQPYWTDLEGITLNPFLEQTFEVIVLILYFILSYFFTLAIAFPLAGEGWMRAIEGVGVVVLALDVCSGLFVTKIVADKRITRVEDLAKHYLANHLLLDLLLVVIILIGFSVESPVVAVLKLAVLVKLPACLDRLERLEASLISTTYKERYWSLVKLFIFNFCYAHLLALLLKFMAAADSQSNWIVSRGLAAAPWYEVYVWSYYWAVNIMLTVGFGDIAATHWQEALCLIFIETISCMVLAYNINLVGSLIS